VYLVFADDSAQAAPTRPGIGAPVHGAGCLLVENDAAGDAESRLDELCTEYGFPPTERFKWSPGKDLWMRDNLRGDSRLNFFLAMTDVLRDLGCRAMVVVLDTGYPCVTGADEPDRDLDAVQFLISQMSAWLDSIDDVAVMLMDQPGGDAKRQKSFALSCREYARPVDATRRRIMHAPIPADSGLVRLLQAADIATSCTLAFVSGEIDYSPPIFEQIRELLCVKHGLIGSAGLTIHPSFKYVNLYHWLIDDQTYRRGHLVAPLPLPRRPYTTNAWSI
jgi:hypothetical protein